MNYLFPEIGNILLIFAFVVCTCFLAYFLKHRKIIDEVNVVCSRVVFLQFGLIFLSFLFLVLCFLTDDFSVINVAQNSNSKLPWYYKITASWGSHEGSILLWLLVLNFWTFLITIVPNNIEKKVFNDVIVVQNIITLGLYLFVLLTSNPFDRFNDPPFDGRDLNPLLQDPGMIFHPPLLYLGYVGFSIVFSLAIAGLVSGKLDSKWARWSRPWTILAWSFLTFGIGLGSWWAYNELGWGGWWFWDPVENASLMPWLCATALIHSLIVSEKLGIFKNWTILLAISTFSLSLLGTFLVRSGVITSVHAFASDPARGVFILCFLFLLVGSSLTLYSFRMKNVISQNLKNFFSKEFFLLLNNVIMIASTFTVLLGTIYPIVMDIFGLSKISIGPPYYEKLLAPIFLPMFFLMAFSILINWKKNTLQITVKQISKIIVVAFIFCLFLNLLTKFEFNFVLSVMLLLILLPAISVFSLILKPNNFKKIKFNFLINKSGMYFSHIGVAIFAFGVLYVNSFDIESDSKISIGEKINVGSYIIKLESTKNIKGSNYDGIQGIFKVNDINGRDLGFLYPEKRFYVTQKTTMTESSVKKIWFDDLYLSLGEQLDNETWIIRAYYKPFIMFLWIGVILIGLGGIFSLLQYYSFNSSTLYVKKN